MAFSHVHPENLTREQCVFLAKTAEKLDRYDDMYQYMEKLVSIIPAMDLTAEEKELISVSSKKVVGSHRAALPIVSAIDKKETSSHEEEKKDKATVRNTYKSTLVSSLSKSCESVLKLLKTNLLPSSTDSDNLKVLYLKMIGDYYHRYSAEIKNGDERKEDVDSTLADYETAQEIPCANFAVTIPIRLGLILNFSVFCYEFPGDADKAIQMTKEALDETITQLDTLDEEDCKDPIFIMQLFKSNLKLWGLDLDY